MLRQNSAKSIAARGWPMAIFGVRLGVGSKNFKALGNLVVHGFAVAMSKAKERAVALSCLHNADYGSGRSSLWLGMPA